MTIEEFEIELKALLRRAEDAGIPVEDFCEITETIISSGWAE